MTRVFTVCLLVVSVTLALGACEEPPEVLTDEEIAAGLEGDWVVS